MADHRCPRCSGSLSCFEGLWYCARCNQAGASPETTVRFVQRDAQEREADSYERALRSLAKYGH